MYSPDYIRFVLKPELQTPTLKLLSSLGLSHSSQTYLKDISPPLSPQPSLPRPPPPAWLSPQPLRAHTYKPPTLILIPNHSISNNPPSHPPPPARLPPQPLRIHTFISNLA
jgi:hypothetical protein